MNLNFFSALSSNRSQKTATPETKKNFFSIGSLFGGKKKVTYSQNTHQKTVSSVIASQALSSAAQVNASKSFSKVEVQADLKTKVYEAAFQNLNQAKPSIASQSAFSARVEEEPKKLSNEQKRSLAVFQSVMSPIEEQALANCKERLKSLSTVNFDLIYADEALYEDYIAEFACGSTTLASKEHSIAFVNVKNAEKRMRASVKDERPIDLIEFKEWNRLLTQGTQNNGQPPGLYRMEKAIWLFGK